MLRGEASVCVYHLAHGRRGLSRDAIFLWTILLLSRSQLILQVHGDLSPDDLDSLPRIWRTVIHSALARVHLVLGLTPTLTLRLSRLWPVDSNTQFDTLGNSIRQVFLDSDSRPMPPVNDGLRIAHVGGLCHEKGSDIVIALSDCDELIERVDLVGSIRCDRVEQLLQEGARSALVHVHGELSADALIRVLDDAHVLVLPSVSEGQPLVILEAMARGRYVLATRVGGIPDMLGSTSRQLVDPDIESIRTELQSLADNPMELRRMSAGNLERYRHYQSRRESSLEQLLSQVLELPDLGDS